MIKNIQLNLDKILKWSKIVGILAVAFSVAYYYVAFLPYQDNKREHSLSKCLYYADKSANDFWDQICKKLSKGEDCSLPTHDAERVDNTRQQDKDNCFKQYPVE